MDLVVDEGLDVLMYIGDEMVVYQWLWCLVWRKLWMLVVVS